MIVVADTNIIFSFFLNSAKIQRLITDDVNNLQLFVPDFAFTELSIHKSKVMEAADISAADYKKLLKYLKQKVHTTIKVAELKKNHVAEARHLIGHIDMDDVLIAASALSVPCHLWTSDRIILNELRKTNIIKTITAAELYSRVYKR